LKEKETKLKAEKLTSLKMMNSATTFWKKKYSKLKRMTNNSQDVGELWCKRSSKEKLENCDYI